ncbi:ATP-binding protein [Tropicimonas sp.]|uniref:ATP-binding protein n=1 Tax=Tropicimonas sp. TaxID=2067044 RepID=UPI003A83A3B1
MNSDQVTPLLDAVPIPLIHVGPDERIAAINARAKALFGTVEIGRHYVTVLRQPELLEAIESALRHGRPGQARYADKSTVREAIYTAHAAPVPGDPGGRPGALVSFVDVTDVESAGEIRRNFVANVSHELKTPLTALLGFIETLRGAARHDPAAQERFLTIMEREALRMDRLVADLLSLSRVEAGERQRPTEHVALDRIVQTTIQNLSTIAAGGGVTLEMKRESDGERDFVVMGDADQLQQVLTNLIDNAVKYGAAGGRVTVNISRKERVLAFRGPGVQVQVIDYGDGFDPVHLARVTERFYRVDDHRSRDMGGTGLGLAIVKHIVNRHRGRFTVETEPGQGSTFTVAIPALEIGGTPQP